MHELERAMDVDLFLEIQGKWAEDSPHHLVILHEMFCHAASEGQERGGTNHLLRPSAAHAPAEPRGGHTHHVELVGLGTSREELLEIYLEVYKLHQVAWISTGRAGNCTRGVGCCPRLPTEKGRGS